MNWWLEELTTIPDSITINRALETPFSFQSSTFPAHITSLDATSTASFYHTYQKHGISERVLERENPITPPSCEGYLSSVGLPLYRPVVPKYCQPEGHRASPNLNILPNHQEPQNSSNLIANRPTSVNTIPSHCRNCTYNKREKESAASADSHHLQEPLKVRSIPKSSSESISALQSEKKFLMTSLQKKEKHLLSEQKRRSNFRAAMCTLRSLLPQGTDKQYQVSHREVLRSATILIKELQEYNAKLKKKLNCDDVATAIT